MSCGGHHPFFSVGQDVLLSESGENRENERMFGSVSRECNVALEAPVTFSGALRGSFSL